MSETFYNILGVSEKSTAEDIKKAYRTLSLKHHPDRNNNSPDSIKTFQKIGEAYETLSDDSKRREYDMRNNNPFFKMHSMNGHGDVKTWNKSPLDEIFQSFFTGGMPGGMHNMNMHAGGINEMMEEIINSGGLGMGIPGAKIHVFTGNGFNEPLRKPVPIVKTIEINMEQVLNGAVVPLDIERWLLENNLKVFEKETLYVTIPKGIDDNEIIVLREKGNLLNDNIKGDVKIFIKIINKTSFERKGIDLFMTKTISLKEALCGFSFEINYLNGKTYTLNNNTGNIIQSGYKKIINNMGLTRENTTGNLIIEFHVEFPEKISEEKIAKLKEIL